jgi:pimeloyl-ACP methyl ester carboxylesterase
LTTRAKRGRVRRPLLLLVTVPLGAAALLVALLAGWLAYAGARLAWTETADRKQAAPAGGRWLRAYDTDVHVRDWGPAKGPVVLLVHGTGAWSGTWVSNVDALAAAGFRVVALDLPPFGFSELPASRDYSREAQAQRILGVAAQLGSAPLTLVGHSFGGGPAAEAAMREPARFAHLVLVDAAIGLQPVPAPCAAASGAQGVLGWRGLRTLLVAAVGTEPAFSSHWLRQFVARQEAVTPERTALYQQPFAARGFSGGLGDWAWQFATGCEHPASTRPEGFRRLDVPVTLLWGELDTITPLPQARALEALLPRRRLQVLQGVGHIPQIEDVAAFNGALVEALRAPP